MVVDLSGYVGTWPYWQNHHADITGDKLVGLMNRWGISQTFITSLCGIFYDDEQGNQMTFDAAARHPDRLLPAVTISTLTDRDNGEYIKQCADQGARVLRLYPSYHGYRLSADNAPLMKLIRDSHELGMLVYIPVRIIMNWGLPAVPVSDILSFVSENDDIPFIVDCFNAGEYLPLIEFSRKNKNIYLGTTALTRYRGIEHMVQAIGADRILAGFAAPHQYVSCGLGKVKNAEITAAEVEAILGGNAARIFGTRMEGGTSNAH